jgi:alanyl-tRNA synthetase
MTERLYLSDPYCTTFDAQVMETQLHPDRLAVVLDRTAFYPTGGGQPHDTGTLNGAQVIEVVERDHDAAVVHLLPTEGWLSDDQARAEIDWSRRFDHMQQHTGQHILSQAFVHMADADTVGFHMSGSYSTIDLNRETLSDDDLTRAESLANQIVFDDRPVSSNFVTLEEARQLPLRKPPALKGAIRIVLVEGFDWSACGGTHVARTGAVGIIKVVHSERRRPETRLTFLCGRRALAHYAGLNRMTSDMGRRLTVAVEDLPATIERLQNEAHSNRKEKERLHQSLLDHEAAALATGSQLVGSISVVSQVFEGRVLEDIRQLASRIASQPGHIALLGLRGKKAQIVFACAPELDYDMRRLLQDTSRQVGGGGGGSPDMAQGGGCDPARLEEALQHAVELLRPGSQGSPS